jgi:hypothetical protein
MPSKFISFLAIIAFAAAPLISAQTPVPSGTPVASPSPAKHRGHKKAALEATAPPSAATTSTTPAPSGAPVASPSPAKHRGQKKAVSEVTATPSAAAASPTPASSILGSFLHKKPATAASTPAVTSTPIATNEAKPAINATPAPGGGNGLVWVNTSTHVYHKEGSRFYGKTKQGKYLSEQDAIKEGDRAAAKGQ